MGAMPSELWGPYHWVWSRFGFHNPKTGFREPFTWTSRRNWKITLALVVALLVVFIVWNTWRFWPVILSFVLGAFAGHVFWAGQPLGLCWGF